MSLSREEVRKIALLARLELSEPEIDRQTDRINALLDHFEALQKLDLEGIEPTSHSFPIANVMREDEPRPSLDREDALSNAPLQRDGCFVVPRILN